MYASAFLLLLFCRAHTGTNNSSVNTGRTVNWQKTKRIKARVAKKRAGAKEKHIKKAVKGVSGAARSAKKQKRLEHKRRLNAKQEEAFASMMAVDAENDSGSTKNGKSKARAKKMNLDMNNGDNDGGEPMQD